MKQNTKEVTQKLLLKNKLLCGFSMLFIIGCLFLVCYVFFFRSITIDVTKDIKISYEGESGNATIQISNESKHVNQRIQEFLDSITYTANPNTNLTNGSKVQIQADWSQTLADKYNIQVVNEQKEIVVEGLAQRFRTADEISDAFLKVLDQKGTQYFEKNVQQILEDDFTQFYATSETKFEDAKRVHRVFLQSVNRENKDKIVDVYAVSAVGQKNVSDTSEELVKEKDTIYYMITYDNINSSQEIKDEDIYGEKIVHSSNDLENVEALEQVLRAKFLLSYEFFIMK